MPAAKDNRRYRNSDCEQACHRHESLRRRKNVQHRRCEERARMNDSLTERAVRFIVAGRRLVGRPERFLAVDEWQFRARDRVDMRLCDIALEEKGECEKDDRKSPRQPRGKS